VEVASVNRQSPVENASDQLKTPVTSWKRQWPQLINKPYEYISRL